MAEKTTIARPYAQAVFNLAMEQGNLAGWSDMLQLVTAVVTDEQMAAVVGNPGLKSQAVDILTDVCGDKLNDAGKNLLKVLAENDRLVCLPEIAEIYEGLRADEESTVVAEVISAVELNDAQKDSITAALKQRFGREVSLECSIDESLLGGAVIRAGDVVIDGSVVNRLASMSHQLMH